MRLVGQQALITGAAKGIGKAAAIRFAREGAKVSIIDIDPAGEEVAKAIRDEGGHAVFVLADVTDPDSVEGAVETTIQQLGGLSILYNNAGGATPADGPVTETSLEAFWTTIKIDLLGTWLFCKYAIPKLREAGGGCIVNTSSMLALGTQQGTRTPEAYAAAKGAVSSLTRAMAVDYAADKIRVNAIAPGMTLTERIQARFERRAPSAMFLARALLGPMKPDDVVNTALFLASSEASHITGQVISIDSGMSVS